MTDDRPLTKHLLRREKSFPQKKRKNFASSITTYATLAAVSKVTGINKRQLSHCANGRKIPRPAQRQRIADGLHKIGSKLLAVV